MYNGRKMLLISALMLWVLTGCGNNHSYRFFTENDSYHPVERPDANYTSGILYMASPAKLYEPDETPVLRRLNPYQFNPNEEEGQKASGRHITLEYGLGQTFYTPDDISLASLDAIDRNDRPLSEDRPYAGLLFLQGVIHNYYHNYNKGYGDLRRSVFGKVGLTGNGSLSEEVHSGVHDSRNLTPPEGWGLQVGQELAFTVGAEQRNRLYALGHNRLFGADIVSNVKGSLGSIYTALEAGVTLRAGFNLPRSFQENSITEQQIRGVHSGGDSTDGNVIPGMEGDNGLAIPGMDEVEEDDVDVDTDLPPLSSPSSWHFYVFVGHQTRFVLRDFSLDGRLFNNDIHTVEREPIVNEFQYGGQIRIADNWTIQALFAHRDKQFKTQRKEHSFGQYMIMYQRPFLLN
ncbi:MAG: lipid A deacylase LpxR family protein [Pseudomonadota bacterium]